MKQIFALLLCLALLGACVLPVAAQDTAPTTSVSTTEPTDSPAPVAGANHIMAIFCGIVVLAGGAYLLIGLKKSKRP